MASVASHGEIVRVICHPWPNRCRHRMLCFVTRTRADVLADGVWVMGKAGDWLWLLRLRLADPDLVVMHLASR